MSWPAPYPERLIEVTEENFEELSVCAECGPEAFYWYFQWAKRTHRKLILTRNGEIDFRPSLAWPDPPWEEEFA